MSQQLLLMDDDTPWRLDPQTREIGRRGVADARAVLAQVRVANGAQRADDHSLAA